MTTITLEMLLRAIKHEYGVTNADEKQDAEVTKWLQVYKPEDDEAKTSTAKRSAARGKSGNKGKYKPVFIQAWQEGKLALSMPEFRERCAHIKYFATDNDARAELKKSRLIYKWNSDDTVSLIKPPKLEMVDAAE